MNASVKGNDIDHVTEAQKQIVRIMKDNKLLNEDIKGIDIDLNFQKAVKNDYAWRDCYITAGFSVQMERDMSW